jgi:hypothetical protein
LGSILILRVILTVESSSRLEQNINIKMSFIKIDEITLETKIDLNDLKTLQIPHVSSLAEIINTLHVLKRLLDGFSQKLKLEFISRIPLFSYYN